MLTVTSIQLSQNATIKWQSDVEQTIIFDPVLQSSLIGHFAQTSPLPDILSQSARNDGLLTFHFTDVIVEIKSHLLSTLNW
jgi:hypothetical protein